MGASDNVLAGLLGASEGIRDILIPYLSEEQKFRRESELARMRLQQELVTPEQARAVGVETEIPLPSTLVSASIRRRPTEMISPEQAEEVGLNTDVPLPSDIIKESMRRERVKMAAPSGPGKEDRRQDVLEAEHRRWLSRGLSNRSGGIGMQDAKVNQAIHLRSLLDQYYDKKTGKYNVPRSQYTELAIGLANLVSGSNVATEHTIQEVQQRTASGDIAGAVGYITGTTPSASTQKVFENLADSIDRQGEVSEDLRDAYIEDIKKARPTGLAPDRARKIESAAFGSSYREHVRKSPSRKRESQPGKPGKTDDNLSLTTTDESFIRRLFPGAKFRVKGIRTK